MAYLGVAFVALGLLANKWFIEIVLTSDGAIESQSIIAAIYSLQTILIASGAFLLIKRPFIRVKRPGKAELILFGSTLVMALVLAEFAARIVLPPTITYEEVVEVSLFAPERLFPPNLDIHYDIRGLYEGAEEVNLRTSANRLISPEPNLPARHNVLFVGGSTTEALYVPEDQRWVALLNEPGELGAYNGAQSGANILDKYFTFEYLTSEKGFEFDLVVLMTAVNDLSWLRRLNRTGGSLGLPNYRDDLKTFYESGNQRTIWEGVKDRIRLIYEINHIVTAVYRSVSPPRPPFNAVEAAAPYESAIAADYREKRDWTFRQYDGKPISLDRCESLDDDLRQYKENALRNIGALVKAVEYRGAKLLVLSEPMSYGASSDGFYEDFRQPSFCPNGVLSDSDAYVMWQQFNELYLEAAHEAGALTFDLASAVDLLFNGPQGGRFVYDAVHYTTNGSQEVARVLRPVLSEILEQIEHWP